MDASAVPIDSTAAKKVPNFITQPETRTKMEMGERERGVVGEYARLWRAFVRPRLRNCDVEGGYAAYISAMSGLYIHIW